jgi:hypothetical protein
MSRSLASQKRKGNVPPNLAPSQANVAVAALAQHEWTAEVEALLDLPCRLPAG